MAATAGNDAAPVFRITLKRIALKRVDLVTDKTVMVIDFLLVFSPAGLPHPAARAAAAAIDVTALRR
jgi:hypothetical protein